MSKALTLTIVFQANSLNYGEGIANISELKKIHRGDGSVYTFASRQSIRYDIVRLGNELFGWNLDTVDKTSGVIQFKKGVTIEDSVEMDLFGYLKTDKQSKKRAAAARLSHAISLEPYRSDLEFLNNMGLAERIDETPNIANIEHHESLYTYTVTIDLTRIGKDINDDVEISQEKKKERVQQLLDILKILNRNIRGRQENLSPLFIMGGVYPIANPFFLGKIKLVTDTDGWAVELKPLRSTMEQTFAGKKVGDYTFAAMVDGMFTNETEFKETFKSQAISIEGMFQELTSQLDKAYEVI